MYIACVNKLYEYESFIIDRAAQRTDVALMDVWSKIDWHEEGF